MTQNQFKKFIYQFFGLQVIVLMVWACIKIIFQSHQKKSTFFKVENRRKKLYPPPFFKMKPYDPEPILKVYIPVFRPPGYCIDGLRLGIYKDQF